LTGRLQIRKRRSRRCIGTSWIMPVKKAFGAHRSDEYIGSVQYDPLQPH